MDIIVDIDGTIADCRHRRHFVNDGNKDWKSFYEAMTQDSCIEPIKFLIINTAWVRLVYCTGRPEEYRPHTEEWLKNNGFYWSEIYMRKTGDFRPDYIVKEEMLDQMRRDGYYPQLAIDDKQDVVDMWRRNGIITLQNSMKELP
jgi:hypothetical protein